MLVLGRDRLVVVGLLADTPGNPPYPPSPPLLGLLPLSLPAL